MPNQSVMNAKSKCDECFDKAWWMLREDVTNASSRYWLRKISSQAKRRKRRAVDQIKVNYRNSFLRKNSVTSVFRMDKIKTKLGSFVFEKKEKQVKFISKRGVQAVCLGKIAFPSPLKTLIFPTPSPFPHQESILALFQRIIMQNSSA